MDREEYLAAWKNLSPLVLTLTHKSGRCKHEVGESYTLKNPYDRPPQLCSALLHVLQLYTWRLTLGFPSWEADEPDVYRVHCPSKTGTVWEIRKAKRL